MEVRPGDAEAHRHRLAGPGCHLHCQALTLGLARVDHDRLPRVLDQVGERCNPLDLREVDERLHRLALTEEEAERLSARAPMVFLKPEAEQTLGGLACAWIGVKRSGPSCGAGIGATS